MHVGFIITSAYQLFHYRRIQAHVERSSAFIEVRDQDFGVTESMVRAALPGADVKLVNSKALKRIDGVCDVLVCQTPVPLMHFFSRSLTIAQQYSLAKEQYQYGVWRAQASLNLMYGPYSVERVQGFSNAVAVGNPLLDDVFSAGTPAAPTISPEKPRALYMPTYGDLSDKAATLEALLAQGVALSIKAHHADFEIIGLAKRYNVPLHLSAEDPVRLIQNHDFVISDFSGAVFDALAARKPVVLVDDLNIRSEDTRRLSADERNRAGVDQLAQCWQPGEGLITAATASAQKLADDGSYNAFLDRYFVNRGAAGKACADAIRELVEHGEPDNFSVRQVRETARRYIVDNRDLKQRLLRATPFVINGRRMGWRELLKRTLRTALLRMPGGVRMLDATRQWRGHEEAGLDESTESPLPLVPAQRREAILRLLEDALRKQGVEFRSFLNTSRAYCAVREDSLNAVLKALRGLDAAVEGARFKLWMGAGAHYRNVRMLDELKMSDLLESDSICVGLPYRQGKFVLERDAAAEILVLEQRDRRLVAKRWRADKVDWTEDFQESVAAPAIISPPSLLHALEREPIDVVYTWVDSSDPDWQAERAHWAERENIELVSASNEERYIDRDELRYSLRSVHLYAPFVRNIYLVTAGHRPRWLNEDTDRIRVVPHSEIFPDAGMLPTFNSHAIEACLHLIPGLSENFIYFNDDVFLGREVTVEDFFTKAGLIKSRFSPTSFTASVEPDETAIPTDWASYNAIRLIDRDFGLHFDRKMKHVPMPLKRSMLQEIEERYAQEMTATRAARFRSRSDISFASMFAHYYAIATGRGVEWANISGEYAYADTGREDFPDRLRSIDRVRPTFLCLNVTRHTDISLEQQAVLLQEDLQARYPVPSPFEID